MTINEFEANELLNLIGSIRAYKKGGAPVFMTEALKKSGTLNEFGIVNGGSYKYLMQMEKKLKALIREANAKIRNPNPMLHVDYNEYKK